MPARMTWARSVSHLAFALLAPVLSLGCGSQDLAGPDPLIAPLVGNWRATEMVVQSKANPDVAPDIVGEVGASFTLNIQESGQYTAILVYSGQPATEIGRISVSGSTLTFHVEFPAVEENTATFAIEGNQLTLDGPTTFDFNLDGTPEDATAHIVLIR